MDSYYSFESRDMRCANDVGRMAALGRFDKEFLSYGCAYLKDDVVYYRISSDQGEIQRFFEESIHDHLYPTFVESDIYRSPVPAGMEEEIRYKSKYRLAQSFKEWYPTSFFYELAEWTQIPANDVAADLLQSWFDEIRYHFDLFELQGYQHFLARAHQAKKLTDRSYHYFHEGVEKIVQQFADDPIVKERFDRSLYGFMARDEEGKMTLHFDAQRPKVFAQYLEALCAGNEAAPVLEKTYTFHDFSDFSEIRGAFKTLVRESQGPAYFRALDALRGLPSPVDRAGFSEALARQQDAHTRKTFTYYGRLWQIL